MTKLGFNYTKRSLEWFLIQENRFLFYIECNGNIIGYCGGFRSLYHGDGSTSGMLQYAMKDVIKGLMKKPYLIFHRELIKRYPLIIKNICRKLFGTKKIYPVTPLNETTESKIGLVVIGIYPQYRGKGYFEILMRHFEEECKKKRAEKIILSVKASNARAIAAYKKIGWLTDSQTQQVINMYKMLN